MDFGNLCGSINVDAIRGKIALPTLPSMPEIKLPKSMAKLKSCKLFRSSRENIQVTGSKRNTHSQRVEAALHPAEFINHTPTRISTISSLMQESQGFNLNEEDDQSSYRRAHSIDDYPTPLNQKGKFDYKRPSSSIRGTSHLPERPALQSPNNVKLSLRERLQKTYKNISEFNLKQVFAKETVVRKDNIVVDYYAKRFKEDRQRELFEQEDRDRKIGNNYSFNFKTPCKSDGDSFDESSAEEESSSKHVQYKRPIKSVSEHSDDESGMESVPPKRKPDVTACEFHRVHSPPLHISTDGESDPIKHTSKDEQLSQYPVIEKDSHQPKRFLFKSHDDINHIRNEEDDNKSSFTSEKTSDRIRNNLKMQKSKILRISHPTKSSKIVEQSNKDVNQESNQKLTKNQDTDERLKRIRSLENVDTSADDKEEIMLKSHRTQLASKLHNFKRSFQKTHSDLANTEGEDPTSNSRFCLMEKLQQIRVRKQSSTTDDPDDDEQDGKSYKESFAARAKFQLEKGVILASQVPQRTMEKINETKRHFKKSPSKNKREQTTERKEQEEEEEEDFDFDDDPKITATPHSERHDVCNSKREYLKYVAESQEQIAAQSGTIAWTTKPIFNDSIDLEKDEPTLKPRVLIHQDNTDGLESTLIIAVTRSRTHSPSPFITELPPDSPILSSKRKQKEINTDNCVSLSTTQFNVEDIRRKLKRQSLESMDLDSGSCTINKLNKLNKIDFRHTSAADLTLSDEEGDVRNIKMLSEDKKLYRRKSIEIFETTLKQGSAKMAFEDFDAELKNIPIIEIKKYPEELIQNVRYIDGLERESSEEMDAADDDNSSRVTKILAPPKHSEFITETVSPSIRIVEETIKNNTKADLLINNNRDNKQSILRDVEASTNGRSQQISPPPCPLTSPPPSHSPLNIELEKRSPSIPPLPKTKPPVLPPRQCTIPKPAPKSLESPNKVRISKPLVKTSSLRLTYTDHVHTKDTGKVNKLISCFEKPNSSDKPTPTFIIRHQSLIHPNYTDETSENDRLQMGIKLKSERDVTPTNDSFRSSNLDINQNIDEPVARITPPIIKLPQHISLSEISQSMQDLNSNFSGSLYGSPTTGPSSLIGSAEATPVSKHKQQDVLLHTRRDNRLSVTRDDDRFYSFDSDEDNSYYSISSTNSSRYVVEL